MPNCKPIIKRYDFAAIRTWPIFLTVMVLSVAESKRGRVKRNAMWLVIMNTPWGNTFWEGCPSFYTRNTIIATNATNTVSIKKNYIIGYIKNQWVIY